MAAELYVLVVNPWSVCDGCGDGVTGWSAGTNWPCRCEAGIVSVCPTWEQAGECVCSAGDAADRFQELLEPGDAAAAQERADRLIRVADEWRPGRVAWTMFVLAVFLITCGLNTIGFGQ